jgi:RNA polymerase sigma-70 factor (ECF subfamily)
VASDPTDEELMATYIEQGSGSAFAELYLRYEGRLFGFFVKRLLPSMRDRATDLFQKTWLKVHASRARYEKGRRFSPWLYSIALNTLRDELKRKDSKENAGEEELETIASPEDTEENFAKKEDAARLESALSQLSGPDREALLLSDWEGFSPDELAELWKVSNVAARQRVSRARKRARAALTKPGRSA